MGHGTRPWCVPSGSTLSPFYLSKPEVKVAAQGLHPGPDPVGRTGGEKARERTPRRPALFTGSPLGPCAGSRSGGHASPMGVGHAASPVPTPGRRGAAPSPLPPQLDLARIKRFSG